MSQVLLWTLLGFCAGSIPFSILAGKLILKTDIRRYGDGNPGGANAWKAGGWQVGIPVSILEITKGYLPVMLSIHLGITGWQLIPVALSPILGHAFSPLLRFRGGKALGATAGVWLALLGYKVVFVYALLTLPVLALQVEHAVAANAGMLSLIGYAVLIGRDPSLTLFAVLNTLVVGWKHRYELRRPLQWRPWIQNLLGGKGI